MGDEWTFCLKENGFGLGSQLVLPQNVSSFCPFECERWKGKFLSSSVSLHSFIYQIFIDCLLCADSMLEDRHTIVNKIRKTVFYTVNIFQHVFQRGKKLQNSGQETDT